MHAEGRAESALTSAKQSALQWPTVSQFMPGGMTSRWDTMWPSTRMPASCSRVCSVWKTLRPEPSTTPAGNVSGGTGDVIGLPLRSDYCGDLRIVYNNAAITASTGYTAADTTSPATTTTGDVRGTYALQTASNNSRRLQIFLSPPAANCATITGLLGVAQNLSSTNGG